MLCAGLALALLTTGAASASASAVALTPSTGEFAPLNRPGPRLSVPRADLAAAVTCTPNAARAKKEVALFVPGSALDPDEFSWNWFKALDAIGHPYCSVRLPGHGLVDIQVSSEYVVYAIRHVHALSGRRIAVIGHSQGGLEPRFALRFWPDTRAMVADYVSFGTPNHGSEANDTCKDNGCPAALWQMSRQANLLKALNSGKETFRGISYTNIRTDFDQFILPSSSSDLRGGNGRVANVSLQSVCPGNTGEHIAVGTSDPVAYALTMDALTHSGPARPSRIARSVCDQDHMPGVDPLTYKDDLAALNATISANLAAAPIIKREPPLKRYVFARR
ncbi:lipase [Spongiactinospora rosea]|uniref:Lipase n=1 Tax=Spongiactinospora rosea TaxID=2248750 RepID=A0A366LTS4_9ACTN|nr:lipase [Spongiactinospora rosea]